LIHCSERELLETGAGSLQARYVLFNSFKALKVTHRTGPDHGKSATGIVLSCIVPIQKGRYTPEITSNQTANLKLFNQALYN